MVVFVVIIQDPREELLASSMTPVICCGTRVQCVLQFRHIAMQCFMCTVLDNSCSDVALVQLTK
jgi:hypothetical protein